MKGRHIRLFSSRDEFLVLQAHNRTVLTTNLLKEVLHTLFLTDML